jgi:threonine aldolase
VSAYGERVDALSFCTSKGLGAPVGSLVVGPADLIETARTWRHRYGGAMRQAGIIAAAGLYALDNHVDRLAEDHVNARRIAEMIHEAVPDAVDPAEVETNIVYVDTGDADLVAVLTGLSEQGVMVVPMGERTIRLVTHLDVDAAGAERAGKTLADLLSA